MGISSAMQSLLRLHPTSYILTFIPPAVGRARLPLPELGPEVPRAGGPGTRLLGGIILRAIGWRIEGAMPNLPQFVIIVAPHTSNWDFVIGVAAKLALGLQALWLRKGPHF